MSESILSTEEINRLFPESKILFNEPLKNYTFTKVGGVCDALIFPKEVSEIKQILDYANQKAIPVTVLGNASNLIVRDGGIRGFVLMLTDMTEVSVSGDKLFAQAGSELIEVCKIAQRHSLSGLEFASGIPGSVGGAVYMNAGAYGGEIADCFESCEVLLFNGEIRSFTKEEMNFSYRHTQIQTLKAIVLSATFSLEHGEKEVIQEQMDDLNQKRADKQPLEYPSCGSVFKRPEGFYTGQLIQEAGLQGFTIGGVQVSEKHAGFMVNIHNGTASDYEALIAHVIQTVEEQTGVVLEPEVKIIGEKL